MQRALRKTISFKKRLRIYMRDCFQCRYCGKLMNPLSDELTLDHVNPDGDDGDDNLATACRTCNSRKGGRLNPEEHQKLQQRALADPEAILEEAAGRWNTPVDELTGRSRNRMVVRARIRASKKLYAVGYNKSEIGRMLRRDHSTIIHYLRDGYPDPD